MVIAPASTGKDNNKRNAVIKIAQGNKGILDKCIPGTRMLKIVVIKLIAPIKEATPAR
jgi:hypothetical protein